MLTADDVYDLIDTYGTKTTRWPDEVRREALDLIESDKALKSYYRDERDLDRQLSSWTEDEDGARVEDEDGDLDDEGDEGEDDEGGLGGSGGDEDTDEDQDGDETGEGGGDGEDGDETGDGESAGDPIEGVAEAAEALADADISDMDALMSEVIGSMVATAYTEDKLVEYTRDYDLTERAPIMPGIEVDYVERKVQKISATMQKDLQRIITARSQAFYTPGFRSGRLNSAALHRLDIGDDRVFKRKHISETKNVAVQLVVDCSGSMNCYSRGGSRFQIAMESAWAFAQVLDKLNIQCEIIGFTTRRESYEGRGLIGDVHNKVAEFAKTIGKTPRTIRWEALYHPIFKEFGERFGLEQKRRLASGYAGSVQLLQNIDGASIIECAKRLLARPEKRKLMIVFSDGEPCSGMDSGTLAGHLKWAVKEVQKNGVEVIGIGIETDSVRRFYDKAFVVNNLAELPAKVLGELKRFLTA